MNEIKPKAPKKPRRRKHLGLVSLVSVAQIVGRNLEEEVLLRDFRASDERGRLRILTAASICADFQASKRPSLTVVK